MSKWKSFYLGAWVIIIVLLFLFLLANSLGGKAIRTKGIRFLMPDASTYQLYQINDKIAIQVTESGFIEVIGYEKTSGLASLAGEYQINGDSIFMPTADYLQGDYIYSGYPQGRTIIVNIKTGETVGGVAFDTENSSDMIDVGQITEYQERGLTAGEDYRLTKDMVEQRFEKLNTFDENLYTIIIAFTIVMGMMVLLGIPLFLGIIKRR